MRAALQKMLAEAYCAAANRWRGRPAIDWISFFVMTRPNDSCPSATIVNDPGPPIMLLWKYFSRPPGGLVCSGRNASASGVRITSALMVMFFARASSRASLSGQPLVRDRASSRCTEGLQGTAGMARLEPNQPARPLCVLRVREPGRGRRHPIFTCTRRSDRGVRPYGRPGWRGPSAPRPSRPRRAGRARTPWPRRWWRISSGDPTSGRSGD